MPSNWSTENIYRFRWIRPVAALNNWERDHEVWDQVSAVTAGELGDLKRR